MKKLYKLLLAVFLIIALPAQGEESYYCIQVASSPYKAEGLIGLAKELEGELPDVRVEKIGGIYTLRVGFWKSEGKAREHLKELKRWEKDAFVRRCLYKPERWVYPRQQVAKEEKRELPKKPEPKPKKKRVLIDWEEEFRKVASSIKVTPPPIPEVEERREEEKREEEPKERERFFSEFYLFVDGSWVDGLDPKDGCWRRGRELLGRLGYRFAFDLGDWASLWGDIFGGIGYQKFNSTSRRRGWWDVRYLYLLTRTIDERKYPGFDLTLGRMPILEPRSFWYRNYLDGLRLRYQSTLLRGYIFAGGRFTDSRISTSEEKINLQGYKYLIGRLDHQYYYKQHLGLFYIKEYKRNFSNTEGPDVWEGVRPKANLNWLGLRLRGEKWRGKYWLDISYMWGRRGFADTIFEDCSACKIVTATYTEGVHGFGGELGYKRVWGEVRKRGLGFRLAVAQGSSDRGGRNYYLPRISTLMEPLFGPNRIRYYGELTNPELNNLIVLSLFGGQQVGEETWIELNLLKYLQYTASPYTPFSRYFISPNGDSRDLGYEIDLILDGQVADDVKWRYVVAGTLFIPGSAYSGLLDKWYAYGLFLRLKRYW